ncbi:hypothetical protein [Biformimicrobium ophioploci]|uniref:hypothetical protein n=1 Tax=Biformimicrobium ophioploci TaxID=3036711 RepID=UPI0025543B86|nr:hypothetical protein [Microbulbifer sp. NKW57]
MISDPGYRFYDDTLGVYVFYDRSDVFYRHGRYYRWYRDHWISANHWGGPWYPSPNLYISVNFHDHWHKRLRRHGHRYAGGRHHRPPRRHGHHDRHDRRERHDGDGRHDRHDDRDRRERREERQDRRNDRRDKLSVPRADRPLAIRDPGIIRAAERPGSDRRAVRDWPKPRIQRGQQQRQEQAQRERPQHPRRELNDRRKAAAEQVPPQESQQARKKRSKADKKADKRKQVRRAREPLPRRSNEARRRID